MISFVEDLAEAAEGMASVEMSSDLDSRGAGCFRKVNAFCLADAAAPARIDPYPTLPISDILAAPDHSAGVDDPGFGGNLG